jgi:hypothetical protein
MNLPFPDRFRPAWLASYPRSGNTFLRIILQNLFGLPTYSMYRVEGDDFPDPSADALEQAPFLPRNWRSRTTDEQSAQLILIKTHSGPEPNGRAIYLVREGYAAIDSYFNYHKKFSFEQPSLTEVIAGACEHYTAWQPHVRPNTLLLRYEALVNQPHDCVPLLADFLQVPAQSGRLPSFAELKERLPAFFRRGQDRSFVDEWSSSQRSLFNELHGAVMTQLGYSLEPGLASSDTTAIELARSAARSHRLYLEQLSSVGVHARALSRVKEELMRAAAARDRLAEAESRFSAELAESEAALQRVRNNLWVRLGATVGFVRRKHKPEKGERQNRPMRNQTSSSTSPLAELR